MQWSVAKIVTQLWNFLFKLQDQMQSIKGGKFWFQPLFWNQVFMSENVLMYFLPISIIINQG